MNLFTDIGKDIDDAVALTFAIIKKVPISTIVTTSKDSHKAAIIAKNIIQAMSGQYPNQTKVVYGSDKPLKEGLNHGVVYSGSFCEGYFEIGKFDPLVNYRDSAVVIAPLTDYYACLKEGHIIDTIFMGLPKEVDNRLEPDLNSYNFKCDPYASKESFNYQYGVPFTFIGKDCAYKVPFTQSDFNTIGEMKHPVAKFLKDHAFQTFEHFKVSVPDLYERVYKGTDNMSYCYDPLTILAITNPEVFTFKKVGHHKIATDINAKAAKEIILYTILEGLR